ncbi:hypothetical protein [Nocardia noduli]|uniref:hypothetical protein n=1 Tax=Nocardia noduli TaxID=2815722 RepID=UPI001C2302C8|nr:hypothetical protein [Nocardia noduli]
MQANATEPLPLDHYNRSEPRTQVKPGPNHPASTSDDAGTAEGLLDARQLFLAVAGHWEGSSPLIGWARELSDLHATLLTASVSVTRRPRDFDSAVTQGQIHTLIGLIDEWAILHLPRPTAARRHTHSLGEVISHVAHTYAHTHSTLRHSSSAERLHDAALRLAQVQEGYADLIDEIRALRIELPSGYRGPQALS